MKHSLRSGRAPLLALLLGSLPLLGRAQSTCMLVPVPLAQRTQQATLVVEARVAGQQVEATADGHLATRTTLDVYKVFRGQLPAGPLSLSTPGGTRGQRREDVSSTLAVQVGQQGLFFLEPDPTRPGELRAYAGPQGFIAYDLAGGTASEPFGRYASIDGALYEAVAASAGAPYRTVAPNAALAAATQRRGQRPAAALAITAPTISDFSPKTVTAGTSTSTTTSSAGVLTITGAGFGDTRGAGYVQFRNADDGGASYTQPLASDYLGWSDTQIQVRVPARSASNNAAGTGTFQVADNGGNLATSASALTVAYALLNVISSSQTYRVHLISPDGSGGYTLQYSSSFPAAAKTPYAAALQSWQCQTGMNRPIGAAATADATTQNGENVVRFAGPSELPAGVLGVTRTYYSGCQNNSGALSWVALETDYSYTPVPIPASGSQPAYTWNFTSNPPSATEYDFQSVALHELGHGEQLGHIISATGVMNYAIANGATRRTLDAASDIAGGQNVIGYSTGAAADERCGRAAFATANCPLPVQLTAFAARYQPGQGTVLDWTTASEWQSAAFVVESQAEAAGSPWQAVVRVAAAGSSATPRQYQARDARPLAGTRAYRLRQLDQSGAEAFSPVVTVQAAATALSAYPNPATGRVQLSGPLAAGATARVRLLAATGRCLVQAAGPAGQAAFELPLAGVPAGLYVLEWDGGLGTARTRLVVGGE